MAMMDVTADARTETSSSVPLRRNRDFRLLWSGLAVSAAIPVVVPSEQLPAALSQNQARIQAAGLAGPPLDGLFFGLSRAAPFLADASSYLVSIAALLF